MLPRFVFCFGQKNEIFVNAYSGLFKYRGNGSTTNSILEAGVVPQSSTLNIYGKRPAFSFAVEAQLIRNTKTHFLYGAGIGYEALISNVKINQVAYFWG